jgi:Tfp pilus assembly protein PilO
MVEKRTGFSIPRQSVVYIMMCMTGVLIFLLGGILPAAKKIADLDKSIIAKKYALEEQTVLVPFFKSLRTDSQKKESELLPLPPRTKLSQEKLGSLPIAITSAARVSGMKLMSATPHLSAMTGDSQFIPVNIVLRGGVIDFRKFMIQLGSIPYIHHIEEITIQEKADTREFTMKVWAAIG